MSRLPPHNTPLSYSQILVHSWQEARRGLHRLGARHRTILLRDILRSWMHLVQLSQVQMQLACNLQARVLGRELRALLRAWSATADEERHERHLDLMQGARQDRQTLKQTLLRWRGHAGVMAWRAVQAAALGSRLRRSMLSSVLAEWHVMAVREGWLSRASATFGLRRSRRRASACLEAWADHAHRSASLRLAMRQHLSQRTIWVQRAVLGSWCELATCRRSILPENLAEAAGHAVRIVRRRRLSAMMCAWRIRVRATTGLEEALEAAVRRWRANLVARALGSWLEIAQKRNERRMGAIFAMSEFSRLMLSVMIGRLWVGSQLEPFLAPRVDAEGGDTAGESQSPWIWLMSAAFKGWRRVSSAAVAENKPLRLMQQEGRLRLRKLGSLLRAWWEACLVHRAAEAEAIRCGDDCRIES